MAQAIIAVNDPPVQVIEVAGGEPATVQLDHGPQVWREYRQDCHYHPFRFIAAVSECLHHPQLLACFLAPLAGRGLGFQKQVFAHLIQVNIFDYLQDGFSAHPGFKNLAIFLLQFVVLALIEQLFHIQIFEPFHFTR